MCQQQSVFPHSSKSYHKKIWSRHLLLCSGNPEICVLLPCLASISRFPLYLTVSIFCHSLALLITIADCLLNLKLTSLYHSNFHTVRWKLSGRTGLQDKMEVSEWTKIKSNFSRKKKRKKNSSPPTSCPCPSSESLTCTSMESQNLAHSRKVKREGLCTTLLQVSLKTHHWPFFQLLKPLLTSYHNRRFTRWRCALKNF